MAEPGVAGIGRGELRSRLRIRRLCVMLAAVTVPVLVVDQASKVYISAHLKLYQMIPVVPNLLDITYTRNPGAAFSLFANLRPEYRDIFFFTLSAAAIVVLVLLLLLGSRTKVTSIAFALILGGTIGNLIDRVARGNVIDFIYVHHDAFKYPVFNIADSAITIGVALVLIFPGVFRAEQKGSSPQSEQGVVTPLRRPGDAAAPRRLNQS
jgi:signal peptidase II